MNVLWLKCGLNQMMLEKNLYLIVFISYIGTIHKLITIGDLLWVELEEVGTHFAQGIQ